jgi:hypothetical protein
LTIKQLIWRIGVPLLIIAACSPAAPTPTAPPAAAGPTETVMLAPTQPLPTATELEAPTEPMPTDVPPTLAPTDVPATEVAAVQEIPGRPDAPASPNEYRSDPETLVGATGRPQLLEFFTYW